MSETNSIPNRTEQLRQADAVQGSAPFWDVGSLLNVQADMLVSAEATVCDWLRRRREAVSDTRQLIASMHTGTDPVAALKAQQEWVSRSFRRMAADVDACHATARHLMDRVPTWFPPGGWPGFSRGPGTPPPPRRKPRPSVRRAVL